MAMDDSFGRCAKADKQDANATIGRESSGRHQGKFVNGTGGGWRGAEQVQVADAKRIKSKVHTVCQVNVLAKVFTHFISQINVFLHFYSIFF